MTYNHLALNKLQQFQNPYRIASYKDTRIKGPDMTKMNKIQTRKPMTEIMFITTNEDIYHLQQKTITTE